MGDTDIRLRFRKSGTHSYELTCEIGGESVSTAFEPNFRRLTDLHDVVGTVRGAGATATGSPTRSGMIESGAPDEPPLRIAEKAGEELLEQLVGRDLVGGKISTMFDEAMTTRGTRRIRIVIDDDSAALMGIPWEFLCRNGLFLAAQRDTPILREIATQNAPARFDPPAVIKVLGVISSPTGLEPLRVDDERKRVVDALADFSDEIELDWIDNCTYDQLDDKLHSFEPHILHYIGHSGTDSIELCNEQGAHQSCDGTSFANLIGEAPQLQVVVLNSCKGASHSLDENGARVEDPFVGLATKLIEQDRSAVVAMQYEITDGAATKFSERFYKSLVRDHLPIDQAVSAARKSLLPEHGTEFATPVLFVPTTDLSAGTEMFRFPRPGETDVTPATEPTAAVQPAPATPPDGTPVDRVQQPGQAPPAPMEPPPPAVATPQPFASGPSTTHLDPAAQPTVTPTTDVDSEGSGGSGKRGIGRTLVTAGAGALAVLVAIIVIIVLVYDESGPAYDCINSAAFQNADELPFDDDVFDKLDAGAQICSDAYDDFEFTGPEANAIVADRIDRIDAALEDGEVTRDEYALLVLDASSNYDTVYDSIP